MEVSSQIMALPVHSIVTSLYHRCPNRLSMCQCCSMLCQIARILSLLLWKKNNQSMIFIYALLIVLVNFCCYFISWSALGLLFSSIIIINCSLRTYCPLNSCHLVWLSSYSIWWCFTYIFLLPLHVLYPLSTHKFLATIVVGSSVICVNLACYALILLELRQKSCGHRNPGVEIKLGINISLQNLAHKSGNIGEAFEISPREEPSFI